MNITITFRQMDATAAIKGYARDKVAKLQKFLRQSMSAKVTLSMDRLSHVAEVSISSGGEHLEAREEGEDMYASIDRVIDKLERQIRGLKGTKQAKTRRGGATVRGGAGPEQVSEGGPEEEDSPDELEFEPPQSSSNAGAAKKRTPQPGLNRVASHAAGKR